ncbi:MAG: cohesin domain-containing protein, partial [Anaerolineae bacterium]|nr:cohesin domain-containing protein [Anaerolineae bacterium]
MRSRSLWWVFVVALVVFAGCGEVDGLQVVATPVPEDTAAALEVVPTATAAPVAPAAQADVLLAFESGTVNIGETVVAVVSVDRVSDLYGIEVHLAYDGDLLEVVDAESEAEGTQIESGSLLAIEYIFQNQCNDAQGLIDYAASQMPPSEGVSGGGEIARITFKAVASGSAEVRVLTAVLASSEGSAIPVDVPS